VAPRLDIDDGIEAVRNILPRFWFDQAKCAAGIKGLKGYRKEWDEDKGVWLPRPRHDWASHPADAFRTGAIGSDDRGPPKMTLPKMPQALGAGAWMGH